MTQTNNIGRFYQGQTLSISISSSEEATVEEKQMLANNDLYIGIYGTAPNDKRILSTVDGDVIKSIDSTTGKVTLVCALSAKETKKMAGHYTIEMLIKNANNSFTSPSENTICFDVERRKISDII